MHDDEYFGIVRYSIIDVVTAYIILVELYISQTNEVL